MARDAAAEQLGREALAALQREKLGRMLAALWGKNPFYTNRLKAAGLGAEDLTSSVDLSALAFTTKSELAEDQAAHPPFGTNLTYAVKTYSRLHQTSGTTGRSMRWLDTPESWGWFLDCWKVIYSAIGLRDDDRLFFPFSFGPFIGFWGAFEGATALGRLCIPGGGMPSGARLRFMLDNEATIVACTPTYALRLAEVAAEDGIDLSRSAVRALVVAGEPGGSVGATRERIESAWGARVFDHWGMTEIGPLGIECEARPGGIHLLESECIAEVVDPENGKVKWSSWRDGDEEVVEGELVLTNLGRLGSPLLRYRTGDLVRLETGPCGCGRHWAWLNGGILGRRDDMLVIRGNNIHPSAVEAIIRQQEGVAEFRMVVGESRGMKTLRIELEPTAAAVANGEKMSENVRQMIQNSLFLAVDVTTVGPGSLERFELKARRLVIEESEQT